MTDTTVIIGGAGKTGARVAEGLAVRGKPVRAASRSTPIPFDWDRPATWGAALAGARQAYVTFQPDLAVDGAADAIAELARIAMREGVAHMVLLSGRGEPGAQRAEQALIASGIGWNVVRASWFMQNFSEGAFVEGIRAGLLALPAGEVPEPFVDADDIADVAVATLTTPQLRDRIFEVTGPRALAFAEAVAEIARATGREIAYRQIGLTEFRADLAPYLPGPVIDLLGELFTEVLDGRNIATTEGIEQALGRPARNFADFTARVANSGIWRQAA